MDGQGGTDLQEQLRQVNDFGDLDQHIRQLVSALGDRLQANEQFTLELVGEVSQFVRFNQARVRQIGTVRDCQVKLTLAIAERNAYYTVPLTGYWPQDWAQLFNALNELRQEVPQLPIDPYFTIPDGTATSYESNSGQLLPLDGVPDAVLSGIEDLDFAGLYAGGRSFRAYADSFGKYHWFATDSFTLDYSVFTEDDKAVKGTYAGCHWQSDLYLKKLAQTRHQLARLQSPAKAIPRGAYRTYLAPAAIAELVSMFSWGAISEASLQRGGSALAALHRGERSLSPLFNLSENFSHGLVPRFNALGEVAPVQLPLIAEGQLVNTLVNARTAREYGKPSNGANGSESLQAPEILPGTLPEAEILSTLGTGLYLSNLHYLNWSDRPSGRITGMTRYACFWVEEGEIVAPIENLRFDESLYHCFGDQLVNLTEQQDFIPEVGTYGYRELGGMKVPGALVDQFTYTL